MANKALQQSRSTIIYEDEWGTISSYRTNKLIEARWFDSTENMGVKEFNEWLELLAELVEDSGATRVLIDSTSFLMDVTDIDPEWRDKNVVPRYNNAGVERFAFHMPESMPLVGAEPAIEIPSNYPTGYFARRTAALQWLLSS